MRAYLAEMEVDRQDRNPVILLAEMESARTDRVGTIVLPLEPPGKASDEKQGASM